MIDNCFILHVFNLHSLLCILYTDTHMWWLTVEWAGIWHCSCMSSTFQTTSLLRAVDQQPARTVDFIVLEGSNTIATSSFWLFRKITLLTSSILLGLCMMQSYLCTICVTMLFNYRPNTGRSLFEETKADLLNKYVPVPPDKAGKYISSCYWYHTCIYVIDPVKENLAYNHLQKKDGGHSMRWQPNIVFMDLTARTELHASVSSSYYIDWIHKCIIQVE